MNVQRATHRLRHGWYFLCNSCNTLSHGCIDIFVDYQVLHSEQDYVLFYRSFLILVVPIMMFYCLCNAICYVSFVQINEWYTQCFFFLFSIRSISIHNSSYYPFFKYPLKYLYCMIINLHSAIIPFSNLINKVRVLKLASPNIQVLYLTSRVTRLFVCSIIYIAQFEGSQVGTVLKWRYYIGHEWGRVLKAAIPKKCTV